MGNSVGIVTDAAITNNLEAQVTRDLLVLKAEFDVALYDPERRVPSGLVSSLQIEYTEEEPSLYLVYRTGEDWPEHPENATVVKRDMVPSELHTRMDGEPKVGYYLKPQGRDIPSRAEQFLNRAYPRGTGNANPMITLIWG